MVNGSCLKTCNSYQVDADSIYTTIPDNADECTECALGVDQKGYICTIEKCEPPVTSTCKVGSIYLADDTCVTPEDFQKACSLPTAKPIGVVYYVINGGTHGKIIGLKDVFIKTGGWDEFMGKDRALHFGLLSYDVPTLSNYSETLLLSGLKGRRTADLFNGKQNTKNLLSTKSPYCIYEAGTGEYVSYCIAEAAQVANEYYPYEELKNTKFGQGYWYLPAIGELMDVCGYNFDTITALPGGSSAATCETLSKVNATFAVLQAKNFDARGFVVHRSYFSSTELDSEYAWGVSMAGSQQSVQKELKNSILGLRPSLEF